MLPYRILIFYVFGTFSFSSLSFLIPFLLAFHQHRIRAVCSSEASYLDQVHVVSERIRLSCFVVLAMITGYGVLDPNSQ
jgi:hypothetical protein